MSKKVSTIFIIILLLGAGCSDSGWTGFYYDDSFSEMDGFNSFLRAPSKRSHLGEFLTADDCQRWALEIRKSRISLKLKSEDVFYCAQGCSKSIWGDGINCNDKNGVLSTFER